MYVYMYVCRFENVVLRCPTPRLHCFLSSHWPSFRLLSFMAFLIPSIQFFFGLPQGKVLPANSGCTRRENHNDLKIPRSFPGIT